MNLTPSFDTAGISSDGKAFTGGLDGKGFAYSATLLGATACGGGSAGEPLVSTTLTGQFNGQSFTPAFGGAKGLWMTATGTPNGSPLQQLGAWTAPSAVVTNTSVSPNAGAGSGNRRNRCNPDVCIGWAGSCRGSDCQRNRT